MGKKFQNGVMSPPPHFSFDMSRPGGENGQFLYREQVLKSAMTSIKKYILMGVCILFFEGRPLLPLHNTKGAVAPVILSPFYGNREYAKVLLPNPPKISVDRSTTWQYYVPSWRWQIRNMFMPICLCRDSDSFKKWDFRRYFSSHWAFTTPLTFS